MSRPATTEPPAAAATDDNADRAAPRIGRGPLLITAAVAAVGSTAIYLAPLPAELRESVPFGIVFALLGFAQLATVGAALARPGARALLLAAGVAGAVVAFRAFGGAGAPDPWQPMDSVIGGTDVLCAGLACLAAVLLGALALRGPRPARSTRWRVLGGLAATPLAVVVVVATAVGLLAASDGFAGGGFPSGTVAPDRLAAGQRGTVEYCRPNGIPLAMDVYLPPAGARRPAPVALYVHGGGLILGDRRDTGLGAALADQAGALFTPLRQRLTARGFVVASIDYRLAPESAWPAQIEDARCAVRFLRAHATGLGIDPTRIGVWGSSAGGLLASMLGLTGDRTEAGDDNAGQSSAVGAVVDMFGPADLTDLTGSAPFMRTMVSLGLGTDRATLLAASPVAHVRPGAPPFLILQGTRDTNVPARQSDLLAGALRAARVPVTLVTVQGAGHSLVTPGQSPSPERLTATVADFLATTLAVPQS